MKTGVPVSPNHQTLLRKNVPQSLIASRRMMFQVSDKTKTRNKRIMRKTKKEIKDHEKNKKKIKKLKKIEKKSKCKKDPLSDSLKKMKKG